MRAVYGSALVTSVAPENPDENCDAPASVPLGNYPASRGSRVLPVLTPPTEAGPWLAAPNPQRTVERSIPANVKVAEC